MPAHPHKVDHIIYNGIALTMDFQKQVVHDAALAIDKGLIIAIDSTDAIKKLYMSDSKIDAQGRIVMPGLINGHTHAAMIILRGLADDYSLQSWLKIIQDAEKRFVNPAFVYWGTLLACLEMLKGGITTFVDTYFYSQEVAKAASLLGMRAIVAKAIMDGPNSEATSSSQAYKLTGTFLEEWQNHPLITPAIAAHSIYACTQKALQQSNSLASTYDIPLLIHVSETKQEVLDCLKKYSKRPVEYLQEMGLLSPRLIAAHCVHVDQNEIELLKKAECGVIYNPQSNLKLGSGVAPINTMHAHTIKLGIGTDSAASNNTLDIWQEIKTGILLQKAFVQKNKSIDAYTIVEMATNKGAQALGKANEIGSLEVGKKADLIFVDHDSLHQLPNDNYSSLLAYSTEAADVNFVMINGEIVMKDKLLTNLNGLSEEQIINEVIKIRKAIT